MAAFAILAGALAAVLAATALGSGLLSDRAREFELRIMVGSALLSLVIFGLCAAGAAYVWVFAAVGIATVVIFRHSLFATIWKPPGVPGVLIPAFGLFLILYFFNAMAPEASFDGSRYHLGLAARYLRGHGFHRITDNLYASLSQGVEMLYLYAFAFGRHSAAAMVHFAFLLALVWLMLRYAGRAGFPVAGAAGALLLFASPIVGVDATTAYNDVAVAAIAFGLFCLLERWSEEPSPTLLVAIGLVAGFAYAAKYTAWPAVPYALGYVAWKSRSARQVAVTAACASLPIVPWMAKNWLWVHNPVAPFFNGLFPNPYLTVAFEREYRHHMAWYGLHSRWELPMQATVHGSLSGLLGPVFLLSPLALFSLRRADGRRLLLAALVFGLNYFSNVGTRFLIVPLPFVAMAMALALASFPNALVALALVHAVISWPAVVRRYSSADAWRLAKIPVADALRIKPEERYLESNLPDYRVTRMVEQWTDPGATIFTLTPIPEAYTTRKLRVAYQSAEGVESRLTLWNGFVPDYAPTWRLRFRFTRRSLRGIRLKQNNTGTDTWSIQELRVFDGAHEVRPAPGWHATAQPNPWGIERILDGRAITFWTCADTLRPGETVQVDFGAGVLADNVVMEAAPNQWGVQLELEGQDDTGTWRVLSAAPEVGEGPAPADLRPLAAAELKRQGIDYLLIFDGEFGAGDLRGRAGEWGIVPVAVSGKARLYKLPDQLKSTDSPAVR